MDGMAVSSDRSKWLPTSGLYPIGVFLVISAAAFLNAQTQASCTFTQFSVRSQTSTGIRTLGPGGINDYGTVVGAAENSNGLSQGFIRWSSGGLSFYAAKPSGIAVDTFFSDRNNSGVIIGLAGLPF